MCSLRWYYNSIYNALIQHGIINNNALINRRNSIHFV
nr:MAG TPA: hypothetical protein [Caudoviricetes sp.]